MIKKNRRVGFNLRNKVGTFDYVSDDANSSGVFRVTVPSEFKVGKNLMTISPSNMIKDGAQIQIDIVDESGQLVYYEIADELLENFNRPISVYIYPETVGPFITIYIASVIKDGSTTLWYNEFPINTKIINSEQILLNSIPKVEFSETVMPLFVDTSSQVNKNGSGSIYYHATENSNQSKIQTNLTTFEENKFQLSPTLKDSKGSVTEQMDVDVNRYPILSANKYSQFFEPEMVGGKIIISGGYSSSIVEYISPSAIAIFPPMDIKNGTRIENYTASYFSSSLGTEQFGYRSYLSAEVTNVDPFAGTVSDVFVDYRLNHSLNSAYNQIGKFKNIPLELFVSGSTIKSYPDGPTKTRLGWPNSISEIQLNWTSSCVGSSVNLRNTGSLGSLIRNGFYIDYSSSNAADSQYSIIEPKAPIYLSANNSYVLTFRAKSENSPRMDIHLSGSNVQIDPENEYEYPRNSIKTLDNWVGSISEKRNNCEFKFNVLKTGQFKPQFVVRSGKWELREISIKPAAEIGFNPSHISLNIPIPDLEKNVEYQFRLRYANGNEISKIENNLYGIIFSGSNYNVHSGSKDEVMTNDGVGGIRPVSTFTANTESIGISSKKIKHYLISGSLVCSNEERILGDIMSVDESTSEFRRISFPILFNNSGSIYTGSMGYFGGSYRFEQTIYGRNNRSGSYTWGVYTHGRVEYSDVAPTGTLYVSSSGVNRVIQKSTYSTPNTDPTSPFYHPDYESWVSVQEPIIDGSGSLVYRYFITVPPGEGTWRCRSSIKLEMLKTEFFL